jgi:hypothetical protein
MEIVLTDWGRHDSSAYERVKAVALHEDVDYMAVIWSLLSEALFMLKGRDPRNRMR